MLPEWEESPETVKTFKMLAVITQRDMASGCASTNTYKYMLLMLLKFGLDAGVFYLCYRKLCTSFLSMCSLSIFLADFIMACLTASMLFLGPEKYLLSLCFLLAHASATYGALPLPMMCLGLFEYCLEDSYLGKRSSVCKFLWNTVLLLLVWILAIIHSFSSVNSDLKEMDFESGIKALVCEVEESTLITYFVLGLFSAVILTLLPFWSNIPQWMTQVRRLSEVREELKNESSDLLFISTNCAEKKSSEDDYLEETIQPCPPLWLSLTLSFGTFWMPYLICSVACLILGFAVPAYITVNLLWLECTNSLLVGVVFWVNSKTQGPYSQLPENICLWQVYWHLSRGTQQHKLPVAVRNPSELKRSTLFYLY